MRSYTTATLAIIAIASASTFLHIQNQTDPLTTVPAYVHEAFSEWTKEYKKSYQSPSEYAYRLQVFYKTYQKVNMLKGDQQSYTLKLNKFSDMSREELKVKYTGYKPNLKKRNYLRRPQANLKFDNPKSVDWRSKIPPIKNQKECGACWAFAAVVALEFAYTNSGHKLTAFSEQQLVDCSSKYGNIGCNGGNAQPAFEYAIDEGVVKMGDYPYVARTKTCRMSGKKIVTKAEDYYDVGQDGASLEAAVAESVVSISVDSEGLFNYNSGVFTAKACGFRQLDHAVSIVGYGTDSASGKNYWIVRNSWGTDWGEKGYARLEKNIKKKGKGACGVRMDVSYPIM